VRGQISPVNVPSVRHPNDQDEENVVTNLVDDPVVAGPDTVDLCPTLKQFDARGPGVVGQRVDMT
jgi:hypothetical protein